MKEIQKVIRRLLSTAGDDSGGRKAAAAYEPVQKT